MSAAVRQPNSDLPPYVEFYDTIEDLEEIEVNIEYYDTSEDEQNDARSISTVPGENSNERAQTPMSDEHELKPDISTIPLEYEIPFEDIRDEPVIIQEVKTEDFHQEVEMEPVIEESFDCEKCSKSFTSYRGLQSHMKAHKRRMRFNEQPRNRDFIYYSDDDDEEFVVDNINLYDQPSYSNNDWETNVKIEEPDDLPELNFVCTECEKPFRCVKGLKIHMKTHERRLKYTIRDDDDMEEGEDARAEYANDNEESQDSNDETWTAVAEDDDDDYEPRTTYTCNVCGSKFQQRSHLQYHLNSHNGERPFGCRICDTRFARMDSLKVHMRVHTGEKPYICDICGAAFAQMINANVHRRSHTGEKPYRCDECGAAFIKKDGLTVHRRIHTGEKPYTCDQCGAKFAYRSCILSHYKVHNGNLKYKCKKCGAGFALLCNLTRHRKVHADDPR